MLLETTQANPLKDSSMYIGNGFCGGICEPRLSAFGGIRRRRDWRGEQHPAAKTLPVSMNFTRIIPNHSTKVKCYDILVRSQLTER